MSVVLVERGGKKIRAARKRVENKFYSVSDAVETIKSLGLTKFDETLDLSINLGVDPRHSDQQVRGMVALPAGTGKNVRVAVICKEDKEAAAKAAGADIVGSTDVIENIKAGKVEFDVCIATPDMMGLVGQVARVLGPKGLMPNPKLGTVTPDFATAVKNAKSGQVEFRVEKAGIVHAGVGKLSFNKDDLVSNANALLTAVIKAKPAGAKGVYMKSVYMSSTMGPSFRIDLSSIGA
jgi:large subunit ribosomal protein L1